MWNSGKKIRALRDKKSKYSNSRVVRKKISERNKKNITSPPPFKLKLNGRSLSIPDDGYSRNVSYALKLLSAFLSEKCTNKKYVLAIN